MLAILALSARFEPQLANLFESHSAASKFYAGKALAIVRADPDAATLPRLQTLRVNTSTELLAFLLEEQEEVGVLCRLAEVELETMKGVLEMPGREIGQRGTEKVVEHGRESHMSRFGRGSRLIGNTTVYKHSLHAFSRI